MVENLLEEAVRKGFITCPQCGNRIEPDAKKQNQRKELIKQPVISH